MKYKIIIIKINKIFIYYYLGLDKMNKKSTVDASIQGLDPCFFNCIF